MAYNPQLIALPPAVLTTQPNPATSMVPATAFGVVGDGTTDDTAAILNAASSGQAVLFGPGTYILDNLTITSGKVEFYAAQPGSTVFKIAPGSANKIMTVSGVSAFVLVGITFDETGGAIGGLAGNPSGLSVTGASGAYIDRIATISPRGLGLYLYQLSQSFISNVHVSQPAAGAVANAWGLTVQGGNRNVIDGVTSLNAPSRTVVFYNETGSSLSNVTARNGIGAAVIVINCFGCTGTNWNFERDNLALATDDAHQIIGATINCAFSNISANQPSGFTLTLAADVGGYPRFNTISGVSSFTPGQEHLSFTANAQATGPRWNRVIGLVGVNSQNDGGTFPGMDFNGAQNNVVEGDIYSLDTVMDYAIREQDDALGTAQSGNNLFRGTAQIGSTGVVLLSGTVGNTKIHLDNLQGAIAYPASADATEYVDVLAATQIFASAMAADVTITLGNVRAWNGAKLRFVHAASGGFNLIIKQVSGGTTLATIAVNGFTDVEFDGTNWNCTAKGATT